MVTQASKRLSARVLRAVLAVYFVVIFVMTTLQLSLEYTQIKNDITQELVGLENIFAEPLHCLLSGLDGQQGASISVVAIWSHC